MAVWLYDHREKCVSGLGRGLNCMPALSEHGSDDMNMVVAEYWHRCYQGLKAQGQGLGQLLSFQVQRQGPRT